MEPRTEYQTGRSIQIEDGNWFKLHNQIAEALAVADLSGMEFRLLWHLLRATYGWQRKQAEIGYEEFAAATNSSKSVVIRYLKRLEENGIIRSKGNGPKSKKTWWFNKYAEEWFKGDQMMTLEPSKGDQLVTSKGDQLVTSKGDQLVTSKGDQLVTPYKDIERQVNTGGKKPPQLTPQEHTTKRAAMTALNAELPAKERVPYVEPIAAYVGMTKLIDTDDVALMKVHRCAIKVHSMGATVQDLRNWWHDWKRDYRSKGASLSQFEKFISEQMEKHAPDAITEPELVYMGAVAPDPWTLQ